MKCGDYDMSKAIDGEIIRESILSFIRQEYETDAAKLPLLTYTLAEPEALCRAVFSNPRNSGNGHGLRLTDTGLLILVNFFEYHTLDNDALYKIKTQDILFIDRHSKSPWHLNSERLILFDFSLAVKIKLAGSIEQAIKNFRII